MNGQSGAMRWLVLAAIAFFVSASISDALAWPDKKDEPKKAPADGEPNDDKDPFAEDPSTGAGDEPSGTDASKEKEKKEPELKGEALKSHKREVKAITNDLHKTKNRAEVERKIRRMGTSGKRAERDALIRFTTKNKNHEYVKYGFDALSTIGNRAAIEHLCSKHALRHKSFLIALSAAQALGSAKDPRAAAPLIDVMTNKRSKADVVAACAIAAARCAPTNKEVIKSLLKQSHHKKDAIRSGTLEAIGYLASNDAVERLKEALFSDKLARARAAAATGLGHTRRKAVIEDLEQSIQSETSQHVKEAASAAIQSIQRGKATR